MILEDKNMSKEGIITDLKNENESLKSKLRETENEQKIKEITQGKLNNESLTNEQELNSLKQKYESLKKVNFELVDKNNSIKKYLNEIKSKVED